MERIPNGIYTPEFRVQAVQLGLTEYFVFYNTERTHPSLDYGTPDGVYRQRAEGAARSVDKYGEKKTHSEIATKKETKNRASTMPLHEKGYPLVTPDASFSHRLLRAGLAGHFP